MIPLNNIRIRRRRPRRLTTPLAMVLITIHRRLSRTWPTSTLTIRLRKRICNPTLLTRKLSPRRLTPNSPITLLSATALNTSPWRRPRMRDVVVSDGAVAAALAAVGSELFVVVGVGILEDDVPGV